MKLNIGARTRAEGWHTFDIVPGPETDFTGDCRELSQFAANSVDTIYASHVLEHVRYATELAPTLKRWFLVLKPGGTLMISVPDLRTLCHLFLHPKAQIGDRFLIMRMMFGGQMDEPTFTMSGSISRSWASTCSTPASARSARSRTSSCFATPAFSNSPAFR